MRKIFPFGMMGCLLLLLVSCQTQQESAVSTSTSVQRSSAPSHEFRGAWIYDPRLFDPDDVVRTLKEAGLNAVFVRLSSAGAAYYPSQVLPKAPGINRDYAQEYVEAGKRYGVKVHAWHVCFMMHNASSASVNEAIRKGEVMRDSRGRALRPTYNVPVRTPVLASNRLLEKRAMLELVEKYSMDGVQFDYIRYFSSNVDYSATARSAFERDYGMKVKKWPSDVVSGRYKVRYHDWKANQVSSLVKEISQAIRASRPNARISAAVWHTPEIAYRDYGQDWVRWVREGDLDFVVPMNYTESEKTFADWIQSQKGLIGNRIPLYAGIGAFKLNYSKELYRQIELCRKAGLPGYVIYNYDERLKTRFLPDIPN